MTTDNNPPAAVTTPPDGFEFTGEVRIAHKREYYGYFYNGKWAVHQWTGRNPTDFVAPILRKLKAQTVDLIGVPVGTVKWLLSQCDFSGASYHRHSPACDVSDIARKALEEWEQS